MKPHIEEAYRALRLADRDIKAFCVLAQDPEVNIAVVGFHAQQAVEKLIKAVLFANRIEFQRLHDLVALACLLSDRGISTPLCESQLRGLNPFAVTYRYDDAEIGDASELDIAEIITAVRLWAEKQVSEASAEQERLS